MLNYEKDTGKKAKKKYKIAFNFGYFSVYSRVILEAQSRTYAPKML